MPITIVRKERPPFPHAEGRQYPVVLTDLRTGKQSRDVLTFRSEIDLYRELETWSRWKQSMGFSVRLDEPPDDGSPYQPVL